MKRSFAIAALGAALALAASPGARAQEADWTGLYAGVEAGFGQVNNDIAIGGGFAGLDGIGADGGLFGLLAGFNYQVAPAWVIGVQTDVAWNSMETTANLFGSFVTVSATPSPVWSVSGRAGYLVDPTTLAYVIAGWSWTEYEAAIGIGGGGATFAQDYSGGHVGVGLEKKIAEAISARLEGRWTRFGSEDWGTGGFIAVQPTMLAVTGQLVWNFALPGS